MTIDGFGGYVDEMPALRAERLLDAAHAANPSQTWIDGLVQTVKRAAGDVADQVRSVFNFNGKPISKSGLARALKSALGGGLS